MADRTYIAIDLKSFYASVECVARGLDALKTNLVVADESRTDKTICLAVSPSLKSFGIPGRPRLFEVKQAVRRINSERLKNAPGGKFSGSSDNYDALMSDPSLSLSFIAAKPRMAHYIECSTAIYDIYLKYIAPEDIHVYSIDEVFIDATQYLKLYNLNAEELTRKLISEVLSSTGVTATAGIGTNMYLCKVAMDIVAKHKPADENGARIAVLDEASYRRELWAHRPITDFWRVGRGYAKRLAKLSMYTMGDVARCSVHNEDILYKTFGINAELLIDHAWGWEPCTIAEIKNYKPSSNSLSSGQVLSRGYNNAEAHTVIKEMADSLSLDLVKKGLVTDQLTMFVGYDIESAGQEYKGELVRDWYGRIVPRPGTGSINLSPPTSSAKEIIKAASELYGRISDPKLLVRRFYLNANHLLSEDSIHKETEEQLDLFTDYEEADRRKAESEKARQKEKKEQQAILAIKERYGKNAILKGMDLQENATARDRNSQIGGHRE
ncbi:MAG: DNA methylase [Firmicutes bacterium]|nr:DNA methylase [Bacillota bacterium]